MDRGFLDRLAAQTEELKSAGLFKPERVLGSPQQPVVRLADGRELINLCANNYLALANHPAMREAAHRAIDRYGYGMASVRFICGTQDVHKQLEARLSAFLGMDDTILYSSCFDANGGLFETLLDEQDAVISDALNHASIIDGVRLCKAQRLRYANDDMDELEARLKEASGARVKLIATDGVFSMDGVIARLRHICDLAERYGALVMVDDSHATGFVGKGGRGTPEYREVMGRIDILTGTLGKALGGAAGGYTAARKEIVAWLRQRSRPYLFSNSVPPVIAATTLRGARSRRIGRRPADAPARKHRLFPPPHDRMRFQSRAGRAPDRPGDAGRRGAGRTLRGETARTRRLRHRFLLSGRTDGQGTHPHADVRRARPRPARHGDRSLPRGRPRTRRHPLGSVPVPTSH